MSAIWSEEAERAVLAAMLVDEQARGAAIAAVAGEHFYRIGHQHLFAAIAALYQAGERVDPITLASWLEARGQLGEVGGREAFGPLYSEVPHGEHVGAHAAIVRELHTRRQLQVLGRQMGELAGDRTAPLEAVLDRASSLLLQQSAGLGEEGFQPAKVAVKEILERLSALEEGTLEPGLATGWPELDEKLDGGIDLGSLVVVVGVPASGKTNLVSQILERLALEGAGTTALVSAEMERTMVIQSSIARLADVQRAHIKTGQLSRDEASRVIRATRDLAAAPFYIDDQSSPDIEDVARRCTLLKAKHPNLCAIGVDFIQLLQRRERAKGELGAESLTRIAYDLKGLAKRLGVVLFATAQPNDKQIEDRDDKRPQLRDVQGSGGIRQAADQVWLLYRPGQYSPNAGDDMEIALGKNRGGATAKVVLTWEGPFVRVTSPRRRQLELEAKRERERPLALEGMTS